MAEHPAKGVIHKPGELLDESEGISTPSALISANPQLFDTVLESAFFTRVKETRASP
jgi:hypothetical protein